MIISRIFEFIYLIVAVVASYEVYLSWNTDRNRAYLMLFFAVVAVFMFFFKGYYRRKMAKRKAQGTQDKTE